MLEPSGDARPDATAGTIVGIARRGGAIRQQGTGARQGRARTRRCCPEWSYYALHEIEWGTGSGRTPWTKTFTGEPWWPKGAIRGIQQRPRIIGRRAEELLRVLRTAETAEMGIPALQVRTRHSGASRIPTGSFTAVDHDSYALKLPDKAVYCTAWRRRVSEWTARVLRMKACPAVRDAGRPAPDRRTSRRSQAPKGWSVQEST